RGVVEDLARDSVEVEARLEAPDLADFEREEIEEERPVRVGRERDQTPACPGRGLLVDVLQVGGLSAEARPVVDELAVDLPGRVINKRHRSRRRSFRLCRLS